MNKKNILLITISILFSVSFLNAQTPDIYGIKLSRGFIMPHHEDMRYFINKNITEFNISAGFQTTGKQQWQRDWNFPEIGIGMYHANLQNKTILGSSTALYLYFNNKIYSHNNFSLSSFVGIGSAYISKPFNYQTNYLNIAIGSHVNIYANINLEAQIRMPHFVFYTDFGITHFSNGGTKHPNLGLNIPALSVGVKYKTLNIVKRKTMLRPQKPYSEIQILQSAFVRSSPFSMCEKPKFLSSLYADYGRYISAKSRISTGFDILYDANAESYFDNDSTKNYSSKADFISAGLHISYSAILGNVQFTFQQVYFPYQKYNYYKQWQRYGFRVLLGKRVVVGMVLNTRFFQAIFIEPSVGMKFKL